MVYNVKLKTNIFTLMVCLQLELLTRRGPVTVLDVTLLGAHRLQLLVTLSCIHFFICLSLCVNTFDESTLHSAATRSGTLQSYTHFNGLVLFTPKISYVIYIIHMSHFSYNLHRFRLSKLHIYFVPLFSCYLQYY